MKFNISPIEIAASTAVNALTQAIANAERTIKNCGELSSGGGETV